ncbi:unnamed protein product [Boreogadus saida]
MPRGWEVPLGCWGPQRGILGEEAGRIQQVDPGMSRCERAGIRRPGGSERNRLKLYLNVSPVSHSLAAGVEHDA